MPTCTHHPHASTCGPNGGTWQGWPQPHCTAHWVPAGSSLGVPDLGWHSCCSHSSAAVHPLAPSHIHRGADVDVLVPRGRGGPKLTVLPIGCQLAAPLVCLTWGGTPAAATALQQCTPLPPVTSTGVLTWTSWCHVAGVAPNSLYCPLGASWQPPWCA